MVNFKIRKATLEDDKAIHDLYGYYVDGEHVTFTIKNPSVEEYRDKIQHTLSRYPFLVAEDESGKVMGYVCGSSLRPHDAYRWDVESTIIVSPDVARTGIGTALYNAFFDELNELGYMFVYAVIVDTNEASIAMHNKLGFEVVGHFKDAGYKLGKWKGIIWMKKTIGDITGEIEIPFPYRSIQ